MIATFHYTAVDHTGRSTKGRIDAPSEQHAYRLLIAQRLTPTALRPLSPTSSNANHRAQATRSRRRPKPEDIASITHQLSVLVRARIPLVEAIQTIADHEPNERLATVLSEVARHIAAGRTLTESLAPHRALFGDVYIQTIRAAESSGNLIAVLATLAHATEEQSELRQAVKAALIYPVAVLIALVLAMLFLITFVIPRFGTMFAARGVDLPPLTQALMALGHSIHSFWWLYLGLVSLPALVVRRLTKTDHGRQLIDRCLHRVPFLNRVLQALAVSRFASILGLSLSSGVGLIDALEAGGRASGRPMLIQDAHTLASSVRTGQRLAVALDDCPYLPGFAKQLLRAGEAAAELPAMCHIIAQHFAAHTRSLTRNAAKIAEPILIAGLTALVLLVAIAVFVPMWDMVVIVG